MPQCWFARAWTGILDRNLPAEESRIRRHGLLKPNPNFSDAVVVVVVAATVIRLPCKRNIFFLFFFFFSRQCQYFRIKSVKQTQRLCYYNFGCCCCYYCCYCCWLYKHNEFVGIICTKHSVFLINFFPPWIIDCKQRGSPTDKNNNNNKSSMHKKLKRFATDQFQCMNVYYGLNLPNGNHFFLNI